MLSYGYVNFGLLNLEALTSQKGVFKQALREGVTDYVLDHPFFDLSIKVGTESLGV